MPLVLTPLPKQNAAPSNLTAVLQQVTDAFQAMGNATPIMVGAHYLENFGAGSGPRVLFVPERGDGAMGPPHEMGNAASMTHSCAAYIRDDETQGDVVRFNPCYELSDLVASCISSACTGRLKWGKAADDSPVTAPSGFGAGIAWSFTFTRDIRHGARGRLPAAGTNAAPKSLQPPDNRDGLGAEPGENGVVTDLTPTVTPVEE